MRRIISLVFLLLATSIASCQTFRLSIDPGFGFYDMGKPRQNQQDGINFYTGLGIKAVEEFPPFFNQSGSILWHASADLLIGFNAGFLSTGARNSVKDYSGDYKFDMLVKANLYGMEGEYDIKLIQNLKCFLNLRTGIISSSMELKENFVVASTTLIDNTKKIDESNLFMEPSTGIRYFLNTSISFSTGVGYLIDFGKYNDKYMNWSGYRIKTGIAYSF